MQIALYEPDIAQNTGTILRLAACLGVAAHIIEPAGFPVSDRAFRRAGMDYLDQVTLTRHASWAAFDAMAARRRPRAGAVHHAGHDLVSRSPLHRDDVLLFGRESSGVPDAVHAAADARLTIPMRAGPALAQRRDGLRHGGRRGAAADARSVELSAIAAKVFVDHVGSAAIRWTKPTFKPAP